VHAQQKSKIHGSAVGIDYILFPIHCSELSCTQDNMPPNAIKKMLLKEWKHVLPTASFTSMTAQMVNKCLQLHVFENIRKGPSIWGQCYLLLGFDRLQKMCKTI
jgi:hypothetical protein